MDLVEVVRFGRLTQVHQTHHPRVILRLLLLMLLLMLLLLHECGCRGVVEGIGKLTARLLLHLGPTTSSQKIVDGVGILRSNRMEKDRKRDVT